MGFERFDGLVEKFFGLTRFGVCEEDGFGHGVEVENSLRSNCVCTCMENVGWIGTVCGVLGLGVLAWVGLDAAGAAQVASAGDGDGSMIGKYKVTGKSPERKDKVVKTDEEWKKVLNDEQFEILRSKGTEPRFCEAGIGKDGPGVYHCVGCDLELFKSGTKFESGSGWPAFFAPYNEENVWMNMDYTFGMTRVEVLCSRCDGHLGHAFTDGPVDKGGVRFCINSKILNFKKVDEKAVSDGL